MSLNLQKPIIYLITSGKTPPEAISVSDDPQDLLELIAAAVAAKVDLIQIREKQLTDRAVYELSMAAHRLTQNSNTRLLVNDRSDIARAAGADGVHLTARSLRPNVIREMFGKEFLIGSSTHSLEEVVRARDEGADFVVFGPVYETESKRGYGPPVGLEQLRLATTTELPVLALGGIRIENAADCFAAGASGIAAITLLNDVDSLAKTVERLRVVYKEVKR